MTKEQFRDEILKKTFGIDDMPSFVFITEGVLSCSNFFLTSRLKFF